MNYEQSQNSQFNFGSRNMVMLHTKAITAIYSFIPHSFGANIEENKKGIESKKKSCENRGAEQFHLVHASPTTHSQHLRLWVCVVSKSKSCA